MKLGKLQRAHHNLRGHFAPAYLGGGINLRAYIFFIYVWKVNVDGTNDIILSLTMYLFFFLFQD